jgi:peroxiredoxin
MPEPLVPSVGWGVLHLFCKLEPGTDGEAVVAAGKALEADGHQLVPFTVLGHKADLGLMALGPDLGRLWRFQRDVSAAGLELASSYVSLTEVSEYAAGMPEPRRDARLHPRLPPAGKRAICFYPMSKRRGATDNWYLLGYEERERLMRAHGEVGRRFADRVLQLVTGSTGLDDYEWGVTLFAVHPDDLKEVVHAMRFDEASARYAEFGPFYAGFVVELEELFAPAGGRGDALGRGS